MTIAQRASPPNTPRLPATDDVGDVRRPSLREMLGYLVAGVLGATAAAGVFAPVYFITVFLAPHYERYKTNPRVRAFVGGVTAAATGAIAGAAFVLGRRAVIDVTTALIAVCTLMLLLRVRKIPEPLVIVAAGVVGVVVTSLRPG